MGQCMAEPWKHPKSGVWYYRRVVPVRVRAVLGRTEYRISLGTMSLPEAKRRYPEVAARVDADLGQAGGGPAVLNHQQIVALAGLWYTRELAAREGAPDPVDAYDAWLDQLQRADERGKAHDEVADDVDALLKSERLQLDVATRRALGERVFWHKVRLLNVLKEGKSPKTMQSNLLAVSALFSWAVDNERLPMSPAKGVVVAAKDNGAKKRLPYTEEDAAKLLTAAREEEPTRNPRTASPQIEPSSTYTDQWSALMSR